MVEARLSRRPRSSRDLNPRTRSYLKNPRHRNSCALNLWQRSSWDLRARRQASSEPRRPESSPCAANDVEYRPRRLPHRQDEAVAASAEPPVGQGPPLETQEAEFQPKLDARQAVARARPQADTEAEPAP